MGLLRLTYTLHTQMASATDSRYGQKESSDQNFDYMFKILIIGNSSVGKTSFLFRYADDSFTPAFVSTVGIDFKVKTIYRNDKRIKLQIWVGPAGELLSLTSLPFQKSSPYFASFLP